jgi:hypothetical protein
MHVKQPKDTISRFCEVLPLLFGTYLVDSTSFLGLIFPTPRLKGTQ